MAATINDKFTQASLSDRPIPTTLTAAKNVGATSLSVAALVNWPTGTAVHFSLYRLGTDNKKVAGSQTDWKGIVSGTNINNLTLTSGSDDNYAIGAVIEAGPTAAWANDMVAGLTAQHNQDGSHGNITATSVTAASGLTVSAGSVSVPTGAIGAAALATGAITLGYAQITSNATSSSTTDVATGLTTTVTIPAGGRRIRVSAYSFLVTSSAGSQTIGVTLWDGAVGSGTQIQDWNFKTPGTADLGGAAYVSAIVTPAAGSKTYNVGLRVSLGTATLFAGATRPAYILVEAI